MTGSKPVISEPEAGASVMGVTFKVATCMLQHGQSPMLMVDFCGPSGACPLNFSGTIVKPPATEQISMLGTASPRATVSAREIVGASAAIRMARQAIHRTMTALRLLTNMAAL